MKCPAQVLVFLSIVATTVLSGCATSGVPKGYTGPTTTIRDSLRERSGSQVEIYMVSKVDGRYIKTSAQATGQANQGMGMSFARTEVLTRDIPAQSVTLSLQGHTQSASDMQALFSKSYSIGGDVQLQARPGVRYVVRGVLGDNRRAIWVEDADSGKIVTKVIEKK